MTRTPCPAILLFILFVLSAQALAKEQPPGIVGEDFTRRDRNAILYSTKLRFTSDHVPVVAVMVLEGEETVAFESSGPLYFQPEGEGGPTISVGREGARCTASIVDGKPGRIRYWVSLDRLPAGDLKGLREARGTWEGHGVGVRGFEQGSVFGFFGRVLDNRIMVLVEDTPFDDPENARDRRDALGRKTGNATVDVFEEVISRPSGTVRVTCDGVEAVMKFPQMVDVKTSGKALIKVEDVEFGRGFHWHDREDRTYRGKLVLTPDRKGRLAVVNTVDAETLLKGLVPSEIFNNAPLEALKAQAVCARGELFAKLGTRHSADPYMVCSDVHCQVYRGTSREHPRTSKAVDMTRGLMMFHDGNLADSVYSASCGGHTESGRNVWQGSGHPYLSGARDAPAGIDVFEDGPDELSTRIFIERPPSGLYCGSTRFGRESFRWEKTVSFDDVRKGTKEFTGKDVGPVEGLEVLERGVSRRVLRLRVIGRDSSAVLSPELTIRKAFGSLRSSLFVFDVEARPSGRAFRFIGAGFGHGVGMCQYGAIGRAAAGHRFEDIIGHYYSDTEIVRIY